MPLLSLRDAAAGIGVSAPTLRNWVKCGIVAPETVRPCRFSAEGVERIRLDLAEDRLGKLHARANRLHSRAMVTPKEYGARGGGKALRPVRDLVVGGALTVEEAVFLATAKTLAERGEVSVRNGASGIAPSMFAKWRRKHTRAVVGRWLAGLRRTADRETCRNVYAALDPALAADYPGFVYQSLSSIGDKARRGAYYTPDGIAALALGYFPKATATFLDPCCGTGQFLVRAAAMFRPRPERVVGFERDRLAATVAALNLLLAFPGEDFPPAIHCLDALTEEVDAVVAALPFDKFDAVATNPPWGAAPGGAAGEGGRVASRRDSFAVFLERAVDLLRDGGRLSFIVPEAFLNIRTHAAVRRLVATETEIKHIRHLGRRFTGVLSRAVCLHAQKGRPKKNAAMTLTWDDAARTLPQRSLHSDNAYAIPMRCTARDEEILADVFAREHTTLAGNAEWTLGIVTGDNARILRERPFAGGEPVFRGMDVFPYRLGPARRFLAFHPDRLQQAAPEAMYRRKKLVYRFISKKLVFAYDPEGRLTLNSANILVPELPGMEMKVALAFLNSTLFRYVFAKRFATHKVLRGDLERLPFPGLAVAARRKLARLAADRIAGKDVDAMLDAAVFAAFGVTRHAAYIVGAAD